MLFSIIIPVYNRPDELTELLESLMAQAYQQQLFDFEVIVVDDGSTQKSEEVVLAYSTHLNLHYHYQKNTGQGFARNTGFAMAKGDYFLVFDSDCILPTEYLQTVYDHLQHHYLDAFGGPDSAHDSFSPTQKAISYAMTSPYSTGGIRGGKHSAEKFRPRSFNMGLSRKVWERVGGYHITRMGEDIEFAIRIEKAGFRTGLIRKAFVYHKRRTSFRQFFKQLHFFGRARINVRRFYPKELKLVHTFPALFLIFLLLFLPMWLVSPFLAQLQGLSLVLYASLLFSDALAKTKSLRVASLGVWAVFVQLTAYGLGFLTEMFYPLSKQKIEQHKT
ncbi:MAG: glycosyltransferase [Bacteroidetes bacterium]|nr:MAG: glycosyltransferase [Bacteroidota bacterium]